MIPQVTIIIGTRPEAIKLAPVILAFKLCKKLNTRVLLTGQHSEMVLDVIDLFKIKVDINLDLMTVSQDLNQFTSRCLLSISEDFLKYPPNFVIVQGDTSSAMTAALAAFHNKIPIGHVEAGLRTNNLNEPFPEEANRRIISQISNLHFAPTKKAAQNLIDSKVTGEIMISGNTVIDAVLNIAKTCQRPSIKNFDWDKEFILLTVHRRENWGLNLEKLINGIKLLIKNNSNIRILIPLHKNPKVRSIIIKELEGIKNIFLTEPFNYSEMIACIKNSKLILTDSGGIQEEAPALGKPVLILRNYTEREEAIEAKTAKLIGTNSKIVYEEINKLLNNKNVYNNMSRRVLPFGDGMSSDRILNKILNFFNL